MLFRAELIAFSFLDLITKQARLNATVRAFLLVPVISSFPVILEGVREEGQNEVNRGQYYMATTVCTLRLAVK